jgi:hypothetical protein
MKSNDRIVTLDEVKQRLEKFATFLVAFLAEQIVLTQHIVEVVRRPIELAVPIG